MEKHKLLVLTSDSAQKKRGASAEEMLYCQRCEQHQGVFLSVVNEIYNIHADGTLYDKITWERWVCIHCKNLWIEKYAVESPQYVAKSPESGVVDTLLDAIQLKMEGLSNGNSSRSCSDT